MLAPRGRRLIKCLEWNFVWVTEPQLPPPDGSSPNNQNDQNNILQIESNQIQI